MAKSTGKSLRNFNSSPSNKQLRASRELASTEGRKLNYDANAGTDIKDFLIQLFDRFVEEKSEVAAPTPKRPVGRPKGSGKKVVDESIDEQPVVAKRPVGRPKGSGKKVVEESIDEQPVVAKRPVGRPKGSGKKVVDEPVVAKRPVGRPKGSGKKVVDESIDEPVVAKRPVGRPKGSGKKPTVAPLSAPTSAPSLPPSSAIGQSSAIAPTSDVLPPTSATPRPLMKRQRSDAIPAIVDGDRRPIGRPKGSSKYGEPIRSVRVPESIAMRIDGFVERKGDVVRLYDAMVQAGFPSPAEDASYESLDLGAFLMPNPPATFFVRAIGESMRDAGIFPGDVLIVDRSLEPSNGDVVVAALNGEFTVKRLFKTSTRTELRPENRKFSPIVVTEDLELTIWGVVKKVIHNV